MHCISWQYAGLSCGLYASIAFLQWYQGSRLTSTVCTFLSKKLGPFHWFIGLNAHFMHRLHNIITALYNGVCANLKFHMVFKLICSISVATRLHHWLWVIHNSYCCFRLRKKLLEWLEQLVISLPSPPCLQDKCNTQGKEIDWKKVAQVWLLQTSL